MPIPNPKNVTVRDLSPRLRDTSPPIIEKCMLSQDLNPRPPAFAAFALNTDPQLHAQKHVNLGCVCFCISLCALLYLSCVFLLYLGCMCYYIRLRVLQWKVGLDPGSFCRGAHLKNDIPKCRPCPKLMFFALFQGIS